MKTIKTENLLLLSKEELINKLNKAEKEIIVQHDLLKQTFLECQQLQKNYKDLKARFCKSNGEGYDRSFSWVSKIVFTLKAENKPLRSVELIAILERMESMLLNHHSKGKFLSAYLNTAVKYGRIVQQKVNGVRGYYYLLPEWLDEQRNPIPFYGQMML